MEAAWRRGALLLLIVPGLALAGCTGDDAPAAAELEGAADDAAEEPAPPAAEDPAPPRSPPRSNATQNASRPPTPSPTPPPEEPAPPGPSPWDGITNFSARFDGLLATRASACTPDACEQVHPLPSRDAYAPDVRGALLNYTLVLAWEPTSELSRVLQISVETCDAHVCTTTLTVTGTSPIVAIVADAGGRGAPVLFVRPVPATPPVDVEATAVVDQPFALDVFFATRALREGETFAPR